jgi:ribosome biogenesis GTPase A
MVVGVPNVSKSSVINRLHRAGGVAHASNDGRRNRGAPVGAVPGVTRSVSKLKISQEPLIYVFDSHGILEPCVKDRESAFKLALCSALPGSFYLMPSTTVL